MGTNVPDPETNWQTGDPNAPAPAPPTDPPADEPAPAAPPAPDPAPAPAPAPDPAPDPVPAPAPAPPAAPAPAAPAAPAPDPTSDVMAQLEAMASKIAELESSVSSGQLALHETDSELAQKVADLRTEFAAWPQRGGMVREDGTKAAQPFDLKGHGLPQPGVTRDLLPGGQPDELSPVVIAHHKPILAAGTAGSAVEELGGLLAKVGYPNSISRGQNHAFSFDDTIASAIESFKRDFHVTEDPSQFRPGEAEHIVGPWLWEALLRAAELAAKAI